jgi:hypothetical protein
MADDGQTRILMHMGTLLHEMIHGFLLIYMLPRYIRNLGRSIMDMAIRGMDPPGMILLTRWRKLSMTLLLWTLNCLWVVTLSYGKRWCRRRLEGRENRPEQVGPWSKQTQEPWQYVLLDMHAWGPD